MFKKIALATVAVSGTTAFVYHKKLTYDKYIKDSHFGALAQVPKWITRRFYTKEIYLQMCKNENLTEENMHLMVPILEKTQYRDLLVHQYLLVRPHKSLFNLYECSFLNEKELKRIFKRFEPKDLSIYTMNLSYQNIEDGYKLGRALPIGVNIDRLHGVVLTGTKFNELFSDIQFRKMVNHDWKHFKFTYKLGLNTDTLKFDPRGETSKGGLYFARESWVDLYKSDTNKEYVVKIPDDTEVYLEGWRYKANKLILENLPNNDANKN